MDQGARGAGYQPVSRLFWRNKKKETSNQRAKGATLLKSVKNCSTEETNKEIIPHPVPVQPERQRKMATRYRGNKI